MQAEWKIPFDHIEEHWTDRQFFTMYRRLAERKQMEEDEVKRSKQTKERRKP